MGFISLARCGEWGILLKMKRKIIEAVRGLLIKTILPIRKKKEEFFGKLRLSITYRIAWNTLKLMIANGILFFLIFLILYLSVERSSYKELAESIVVNLETFADDFGSEINPYRSRGIYLKVIKKETQETIYNDITIPLQKLKNYFKFIYYTPKQKMYRFVLEDTMEFLQGRSEYIALFYYDMTKEYEKMLHLVWNMGFVYLVLILFIVLEGRKDSTKMLVPIQEMSETVNRLTVNNLHSERLNVEGTKNELKDLAVVFNHMLDRLETSYESQKQFVSDASHELRTPIAVIQGYANMLSRWGANDPEVLQESIEAIQNESKMMQDLVEKLLFLSRHDKKTLKLEKKLFDMGAVVEEMVKETKMVAKNRNVECPAVEKVQVYGDKQSLKQAIRVFIDNAIKYTKEGDTITISCHNVNGNCVICVADTGIGMKKKDLDHIFNRFYRSDDVRNRKIEGHGLGLSIAKLIIMGHTGSIKIRTQYTKGTSFTVTLPKVWY